jgi:glycine zipper 2TM protein
MMRASRLTLLAAALLATPLKAMAAQGFTVDQGTIVRVVLAQTISTKTNKAGDKVQAQCAGDDCGGFPKGTKFFAVLTEASPASGKEPGKLSGKFVTAVLPDGRQIPIEAEAQAGDARGGTKTKKGNRLKTGAAGALLGALVADNDVSGALIGGALGAALGRDMRTTGMDLEVSEGTKFQLRVLKAVSVPPAPEKK